VNQLPSTKTTAKIPEAPGKDIRLSRDLAEIRSRIIEGGGLVDLPAPYLRKQLVDRLDLLRGCVTAATIEQLEGAVAELMIGFPSLRSLSKIEAQLTARKYARDLLGVPLWAVKAATADISKGSVPGLNVDFPPTSPRLRSLTDRYVSAVHQEVREIKEVLGAQQVLPHNPEAAEKVRIMADAAIAALNPAGPTEKAPSLDQIRIHYGTYGLEFRPRQEAQP
jgi:hypothetical protein